MKLLAVSCYDEMSQIAGEEIKKQIERNKKSVLGLATGSTPIGTYQYLIAEYQKGNLDFSGVSSFNLDEYIGLSKDHPQSYARYMRQNFFDHINISLDRTYIPDGTASDQEQECDRYESLLKIIGPQDLQILGLGRNGHIGFNEPSDHFEIRTHLTALAETTIQANRRFFHSLDEVPTQACTMGIGTIMKARRILLLVSGKEKAEILRKVLEGPVTPWVPASILHFHPDVTVIADQDACRCLP